MSVKNWFLSLPALVRFRYAMLALAGLLAVAAFIIYYVGVGLTYYYSPMRTNKPDRVIILTTSWCPWCSLLRKALVASKFPFEEIDVEKDWKTGYAHYSTKRNGIPVTVIGSDVVGGATNKQLDAIRAVCEKLNGDQKFECDRLRLSIPVGESKPKGG